MNQKNKIRITMRKKIEEGAVRTAMLNMAVNDTIYFPIEKRTIIVNESCRLRKELVRDKIEFKFDEDLSDYTIGVTKTIRNQP